MNVGELLSIAQPISPLLVMAAQAAIHASFNKWLGAVTYRRFKVLTSHRTNAG
jgi:hypothetical protein